MISLLLWACPAKKPPAPTEAQAVTATEEIEQETKTDVDVDAVMDSDSETSSKEPPPLAGRQQTEQLLTDGILDPIPSQVKSETPVIIQFRTLYRNGCWSQSEPTHHIEAFEISHSYSTTVATDRMCTMALLPGGFQTEITLSEVGDYNGVIIVDGEERAKYRLQVVSSDQSP